MATKPQLKQSHLPNPDDDDPEDGVVVHDGGVTVDLEEEERRAREAEDRRSKTGGEERAKKREEPQGGLDDEAARAEAERAAEERREARRRERRQQKDERREREERLERRVEELQSTVQTLEQKTTPDVVGEARILVGNIDSELTSLERRYAEAKALKQRALENKDNLAAAEVAKAAVDADEAMAAARERHQQLLWERGDIVVRANAEARRPKVSPELQRFAKEFTDDHPWYKPGSGDRDTEQVAALDRQMASEGWNPNRPGYWEELRDRVREKLPHRFKDDQRGDGGDDLDNDPPPRRRQITGGSGREAGGGGGGTTFHLSRERVDALKEAGMWEDPVKRNKMIKIYRQRDLEAARQRQRG